MRINPTLRAKAAARRLKPDGRGGLVANAGGGYRLSLPGPGYDPQSYPYPVLTYSNVSGAYAVYRVTVTPDNMVTTVVLLVQEH